MSFIYQMLGLLVVFYVAWLFWPEPKKPRMSAESFYMEIQLGHKELLGELGEELKMHNVIEAASRKAGITYDFTQPMEEQLFVLCEALNGKK